MQVAYGSGLVVEASGAAGLAALLSGKVSFASVTFFIPYCLTPRTRAERSDGIKISMLCIIFCDLIDEMLPQIIHFSDKKFHIL